MSTRGQRGYRLIAAICGRDSIVVVVIIIIIFIVAIIIFQKIELKYRGSILDFI